MRYDRRRSIDRDYYYMTLDLQKFKKREKFKARKTLSQEIKTGYALLTMVVITLNLVLGVMYFMINGQKTVLGYRLRQLQITNENLKYDEKKIDSEIVEATSVKYLENKANQKEMANINSIIYSVGSTKTARR